MGITTVTLIPTAHTAHTPEPGITPTASATRPPEPSVTPTAPRTATPTDIPPTATPTDTHTAETASVALAEPTGALPDAPAETFTALTYNILFGAGVDTYWRRQATGRGFPTDRLDDVLARIEAADPDIVAIEEVVGWTDETIRRTADALGTPYYAIANQNPGQLTVGLFSRFEITEMRSLSNQVTYGALWARVRTPDGRPIEVFVAHLNAMEPDKRAEEMAFLAGQIALSAGEVPVLLMGDLNTPWINAAATRPLTDAGLCLAAGAGAAPGAGWLDHIWVSSRLTPVEYLAPPSGPDQPSDHPPVAARLGLFDDPQECRTYTGGG